jgi:NitT/TauT family transport system substrate-binding protein
LNEITRKPQKEFILTNTPSLARYLSWGIAGALMLATSIAKADDKIAIATSANAEVAALYVAQEEGIFAKNGLSTEIKIIALNPTIPASLLSDSIQIGAPTPTVFDQAVDNGLDLVAIAGVSTISSEYKGVAVVARPDSNINAPKDFSGKTVAVPGLNAVLHIALQIWLDKAGVDVKTVRFVEAPLANMSDLLKASQVDAVIGIDPFLPRMIDAGVAKHIAYFFSEVAAGQQTMFYSTTRAWATKNAKSVAAFRTSLKEASDFIAANPDKAREDIIKYFKIPPEAAKRMALPNTAPDLKPQQVAFWADVMKRFGLVQNPIDPTKVMAP